MNTVDLNKAANEAQDALNDLMEIISKWDKKGVTFSFENVFQSGSVNWSLRSGRTSVKTQYILYGKSKQG